MVKRYPGDGAATNGFGCRHLRQDEARLLYEAEYPTMTDMRVPGSWRLSADGVPVPSPPTGVERRPKIARIRSGMPGTPPAFFDRRHADQLAATNGVEPSGRHNSEVWRQ
ncbi:Homeobox protein KNOX3 [Hordeum vulgare]|nr:Homeobox protein KNOX3 [Hordeum vulgare]